MKRTEVAKLRRREILAAYYETLVAEGLQATSIAKIARRLGVPHSLLIHYFGTKEQMTVELVDYLLEEYRQAYGDRLAAIVDPLERLHAILDMLFDPEYHKLLDDSVFYACFYISLRQEQVRQRFATLHEDSLHLIEHTLSECMAAGHLAEDEPRELALFIKSLEEGYALLIGGNTDDAARAKLGTMLRARTGDVLGVPNA